MSGPDIRRLYFSTQEVCEAIDVRPYDLKQWTKKFTCLRPSVSKTGRKLYKPGDIKIIQRIKALFDQGHSEDEIEYLLNHPEAAPFMENNQESKISLSQIIHELEDMLNILSSHPAGGFNLSMNEDEF